MTVFLVLVILVAAGFMLFALCSNFLYWYEALNQPEAAIAPASPGVFLCLRQYVISLGGYLLCVGLFPFGPVLRKKPAPAPLCDGKEAAGGQLPPVILIHGLNNNAAVWLYIGRKLRKAGYRTSTFTYHSLFAPLEKIMADLDAHIREVELLSRGNKPVFICHSLGGILARNWLRNQGNSERAAGIITLGTPHGGSKLAFMAPGALAKNITPRAGLIRELKEVPALAGLPCVSFASPADEAVLPASSLRPPEGWRFRVTHRIGHFSMLFCPYVARDVLSELAKMGSDPS